MTLENGNGTASILARVHIQPITNLKVIAIKVNSKAANGERVPEDDGRVEVVVVPEGGVMVVVGVAGVVVVVDGGEVVVPLPVGGDAAAPPPPVTVTDNFIPPPQWPMTPQMK